MRSQYAIAAAGHGVARVRTDRVATGLGAVVMVAALSPVFAVCGFMLAQILGYVSY